MGTPPIEDEEEDEEEEMMGPMMRCGKSGASLVHISLANIKLTQLFLLSYGAG